MKSKFPTFLIVGAMRTGTTSLCQYLKSHPDIYLPEQKDTWFFLSKRYRQHPRQDPRFPVIQNKVFHEKRFLQMFEGVQQEKAIGDASTAYLYCWREAIPRIKEYLGDVKIIIGLREPVERAYSMYNYNKNKGWERLSFAEALEKEKWRMQQGWDVTWAIRDMGFYYAQVKAYLDAFSNVKVYTFDALKNQPEQLVKEIFEFLEVDPGFVPPNTGMVFNKSGNPKNPLLRWASNIAEQQNRFLKPLEGALKNTVLHRWYKRFYNKSLRKETVEKSIQLSLQAQYKTDIRKLQGLVRQDLSGWLN